MESENCEIQSAELIRGSLGISAHSVKLNIQCTLQDLSSKINASPLKIEIFFHSDQENKTKLFKCIVYDTSYTWGYLTKFIYICFSDFVVKIASSLK